jgi:hypothetical protein
MQESMDKAESSFLTRSVAEANRVTGDDTGSDENLSFRKSDNIGRSGIIEEGPMHSRNRPVTNDCRLDLLKSAQRRSAKSNRSLANRQGAIRHRPDESQIEADPSLSVLKHDQSRHDSQAVSKKEA